MTGQTTTRQRSPGRRKTPSRLMRWQRRVWPSLNLIMLLVGVGAPASAAGSARMLADHAQAPGATLPVTSCASLARVNFTKIPDAPGQVTSATAVSDLVLGKPVSFCDVKGSFAPRTHFEIKLPVAAWQGQYVQEGCEIYCGQIPLADYPDAGIFCAPVENGELALAADDEGHTGSPTDGSWARNSLALRVVFGLTSEHSLARMSNAIITAYYGRPASYAYYDGCSTGGREALMLAQRYPRDFNGIIAGAPASNVAPLTLFAAWMARSNTGPDGHQILTAEKIPALHAAVIHACGNPQGIITDPRQCGFDPASIECPAGTDVNSCLTQAQVLAVRSFYRGPTDGHGRSLFNGGQPYGSELGWPGNFVEPASGQFPPATSLCLTASC